MHTQEPPECTPRSHPSAVLTPSSSPSDAHGPAKRALCTEKHASLSASPSRISPTGPLSRSHARRGEGEGAAQVGGVE